MSLRDEQSRITHRHSNFLQTIIIIQLSYVNPNYLPLCTVQCLKEKNNKSSHRDRRSSQKRKSQFEIFSCFYLHLIDPFKNHLRRLSELYISIVSPMTFNQTFPFDTDTWFCPHWLLGIWKASCYMVHFLLMATWRQCSLRTRRGLSSQSLVLPPPSASSEFRAKSFFALSKPPPDVRARKGWTALNHPLRIQHMVLTCAKNNQWTVNVQAWEPVGLPG